MTTGHLLVRIGRQGRKTHVKDGERALRETAYPGGSYTDFNPDRTARADSPVYPAGEGMPTCYWCNRVLEREAAGT